jgi:hypothetical protein
MRVTTSFELERTLNSTSVGRRSRDNLAQPNWPTLPDITMLPASAGDWEQADGYGAGCCNAVSE